MSLDLTGLPPTAAQVADYLNDPRDDAAVYQDAVDRLLQSKHYGEHWGRHWLDVARYAESSGKDVNIFYPFAWRYRDYVIDAFNADKPYDRFITEQIAGDLLPAPNARQRAEQLIATGYLAIGAKQHSEVDTRQFLLDVADEQVDAIGRGVLGLTVACARCHDHKFDPLSQGDYYSLAGIFASTETLFGGARQVQINRTTGLIELPKTAGLPPGQPMSRLERTGLQRQVDRIRDGGGGGSLPPVIRQARLTTIQAQLSYYETDGTARNLIMSVRDGTPIDLPVFLRGELDRPSQNVPRGFPAVIDGPTAGAIDQGSGRLELARWITHPAHPLTARVIANRVWQHLFGVGLVDSPDNFGTTGSLPTHPELLDHLASSLIQDDWSIKQLIRRIVTSRGYRLGTETTEHQRRIDPDNRWLSRQTSRRLNAESIRDSLLVAAGTLRPVPPVGSPVTRLGAGRTQVLDQPGRGATLVIPPGVRSVYLPVIRDRSSESLGAFDCPDASLVTGRRETTTVASQSLYLMNDDFVIAQADAMARDIIASGQTMKDRINQTFVRTLSRPPRGDEINASIQFLKDWGAADDPKVWSVFCQSLFATAEFRLTR